MNNKVLLETRTVIINHIGDRIIEKFEKYVESSGDTNLEIRMYSYNLLNPILEELKKFPSMDYKGKVNFLKEVRNYIRDKGFSCKVKSTYYEYNTNFIIIIGLKRPNIFQRFIRFILAKDI